MRSTTIILLTLIALLPLDAFSGHPKDFAEAKRKLYKHVYIAGETFYCKATYEKKQITKLPDGFISTKYNNRLHRLEIEHIVPAENFGRGFKEWREGHPTCIDRNMKPFKGRKCASKANVTFMQLESDLHNLVPAIGAVNAQRSNYNFTMMGANTEPTFGTCKMTVDGRKVQPPEYTRGQIARAYLYMDATYNTYTMSGAQKQLMTAWNKQYPPGKAECSKNKKITAIQGNENPYVSMQCDDI